MPRQPKFPGLQMKFERAVRGLLPPGKQHSFKEVVKLVEENSQKYEITDAEMAHLRASTNYIRPLKEGKILASDGPWKGYTLLPVGPDAEELEAESEPSGKSDTSTRRPKRQWEAFLHLPVALVMSYDFNAAVASLPSKSNNMQWGNPDMIMVRERRLYRWARENTKDISIFRKIDASPRYIVSALELKFDITGSRTKLFTALAETAANGKWANETWLVYFTRQESAGRELDPEVQSLAEELGVGMIELSVAGALPEDLYLSANQHVVAKVREATSFQQIDDKLVESIVTLVTRFDKGETHVDAQEPLETISRVLAECVNEFDTASVHI